MSAQAPEPGPDDKQTASSPAGGQSISSPAGGQAAPSSSGRPGFFWVPGSVGTGEVPLAGPVPASAFPAVGAVPGAGPARVLDQQALLDALAAGGFMDGREEDQDAVLADELAALEDGRMGPPLSDGQVAALAVEHMDPGPAMAGWLDAALREVASLDEHGLTGVAMAGQKLASWAQAAELAAVAQVASRAAAADKNIGAAPRWPSGAGMPGCDRPGEPGADDVGLRRGRVGGSGGHVVVAAAGDRRGAGGRADRSGTGLGGSSRPPACSPSRRHARSRRRSCPAPGRRPRRSCGSGCAAR